MPALMPGPRPHATVRIPMFIPNLESDLLLVPRPLWSTLTQLLGRTSAAAYLLIDSAGEDRLIRVGETHDVAQRLVRHRADRSMDWADYAVVICGCCVDKSMAVALQESFEIFMRDRADVTLKTLAPAQTPRIGEDEWRRVSRLKLNVLAALPRLGVILNPVPPRDRFERARVIEAVFDIADIDYAYTFAARGIEAAAAIVGDEIYILAGSEFRDRPAKCALPWHREVRRELAATRRLYASVAPGRVRIASPVRARSLDAAGKMIVGDRHRYRNFWVETAPGDLPAACLDLLAGQIDAAPIGGRL